MVENMHDIPYVQEPQLSPAVTACMTRACMAVNEVLGSSTKNYGRGIQVLAAANHHAVAIAQACGISILILEFCSI